MEIAEKMLKSSVKLQKMQTNDSQDMVNKGAIINTNELMNG